MPPANILRPKRAEYSAHSKLLLYLCPLRLAGRLCLCFGTRLGFRLRGTGRCNRRGRTRFHGPVLARQKNLRATSNNWVCSGYELKYVSLTSLCLKLFFPRVFERCNKLFIATSSLVHWTKLFWIDSLCDLQNGNQVGCTMFFSKLISNC